MSTDTMNDHDASLTHVVSGIVEDVQNLLKQELNLFVSEQSQKLVKAREAAVMLSAGLIALHIGAIILALMFVHLLILLVPGHSTWIYYAIVGAMTVVLGAIPIFIGIARLQRINPVPSQIESTVRGEI